MNTLTLVKAAFLLHFVFDEANKWCYLGEYFKTKQLPMETCDDFIRRVQEGGDKAHADDEKVTTTVLNGLLCKRTLYTGFSNEPRFSWGFS